MSIAPLCFAWILAAVGAGEHILDEFVGTATDIDLARFAAAFHAAGGVHGIAPDVVREFLDAHDASDHRTGVDANADVEAGKTFGLPFQAVTADELLDLQRSGDHVPGVRGVRDRKTSSGHVCIADGLDLLDAMLLHDVVEGLEAMVDLRHERLRRHGLGHLREVLEVGEEHGDLIEELGFSGSFRLQLVGGFLGEDVEEQFIASLPGFADPVALHEHHSCKDEQDREATKQRVPPQLFLGQLLGLHLLLQAEHLDLLLLALSIELCLVLSHQFAVLHLLDRITKHLHPVLVRECFLVPTCLA